VKIAEEIETLGMSREEVIKYYNAKAQADKKTKKQQEEEWDSDIADEDILDNN